MAVLPGKTSPGEWGRPSFHLCISVLLEVEPKTVSGTRGKFYSTERRKVVVFVYLCGKMELKATLSGRALTT